MVAKPRPEAPAVHLGRASERRPGRARRHLRRQGRAAASGSLVRDRRRVDRDGAAGHGPDHAAGDPGHVGQRSRWRAPGRDPRVRRRRRDDPLRRHRQAAAADPDLPLERARHAAPGQDVRRDHEQRHERLERHADAPAAGPAGHLSGRHEAHRRHLQSGPLARDAPSRARLDRARRRDRQVPGGRAAADAGRPRARRDGGGRLPPASLHVGAAARRRLEGAQLRKL